MERPAAAREATRIETSMKPINKRFHTLSLARDVKSVKIPASLVVEPPRQCNFSD